MMITGQSTLLEIDSSANTVIHIAARRGSGLIFEKLLRVEPSLFLDVTGCNGMTPLHIAAMFRTEPVVKLHGAKLYMNAEEVCGCGPWLFAQVPGHLQTSELFYEDDALTTKRSDVRWDACHLMTVESPPRLLYMLVDGKMSP